MRWEAERGLLSPLDGEAPGSAWWRALNERLLRDACEDGPALDGPGRAPIVADDRHVDRLRRQADGTDLVPSAQRQHQAAVPRPSRSRRQGESDQRFFLNVVLTRALDAHALVAAPRLALGRMAVFGPALGDPRRGLADAFLSMGRVLPDRYPAEGDLEDYLPLEHPFGRAPTTR